MILPIHLLVLSISLFSCHARAQSLSTTETLIHDVHMLATEIGERHLGRPNALKKAEDYIAARMEVAGYNPKRLTYRVDGFNVANIEIEILGKKYPEQIIVIGAHYDTVPGSPGANDNGSGVASLLWLAESFRKRQPDRTLRFVAFVNEEPPYFQTEQMGSVVYAKDCRKRGDKIVAMLSLETMGYFRDDPHSQHYPFPLSFFYPDTGNFIGLIANRDSKELLAHVAASFARAKKPRFETGSFLEFLPGVGWSDHWSFWQQAYPAIMITDTAPFRYPHYHTKDDLPEAIDYERLADVNRALDLAIQRLVSDTF